MTTNNLLTGLEVAGNTLFTCLGGTLLTAIRLVHPTYGRGSWRNEALLSLTYHVQHEVDPSKVSAEEARLITSQYLDHVWSIILGQ